METVRLTVGQAVVRFLARQHVERDGREHRFIAGVWGIFGHGNVAGLGQALEELGDSEGMPYAELWRLLRPVARRLGERQPSYSQLRRLAKATRPVKRLRKQELDLILSRTLAGLSPIPL